MTTHPDVPTLDLATAQAPITIPQLGFGVWQVPDSEVDAAVAAALEAGYRHLDTARISGTGVGVGRAIAASGLPREDLFVTTKVWNDDHGRARTREAFHRSLERLGLDVLDLYLIHWPTPRFDDYVETWEALQALRDEGLVRAIGVCNFGADHLTQLYKRTGEWPAINQVELHPYLQQEELRDFHHSHGIVTESWSPLASGKEVLDDLAVAAIAQAHRVTPAQVILAWHRQLGLVAIPKSVTPSRIRENLASLAVELTDAEMLTIATLDRRWRTGPDPEEFHVR